MSKKRTIILHCIFTVLIIALLVFIFGNSLQTKVESIGRSQTVLRIITPILERIVGTGNVTLHLVRKLAHFAEFCLLGVFFAALHMTGGKHGVISVLALLFLALITALTDETIQLLSNRGSQVKDVWLDFAGAIFGLLVALHIWRFLKMIFRKRNTRSSRE